MMGRLLLLLLSRVQSDTARERQRGTDHTERLGWRKKQSFEN